MKTVCAVVFGFCRLFKLSDVRLDRRRKRFKKREGEYLSIWILDALGIYLVAMLHIQCNEK